MNQDSVVELRDTSIRIEIELRKQDRPAPTEKGWTVKDKLFPYTPVMKVYVGEEQIGLISKLSMTADNMDNVVPLIEVSFAEGLDATALTSDIREALAKYAELLRQFPFVQVSVPMVPVV